MEQNTVIVHRTNAITSPDKNKVMHVSCIPQLQRYEWLDAGPVKVRKTFSDAWPVRG
jgi:hypothetical protein